ncbi:hypothetical protein ACH4EC_39145 [Streptomyces anulatus]
MATEIADQVIAPFLVTAPRTGPHREGDVLAVSRIGKGWPSCGPAPGRA